MRRIPSDIPNRDTSPLKDYVSRFSTDQSEIAAESALCAACECLWLHHRFDEARIVRELLDEPDYVEIIAKSAQQVAEAGGFKIRMNKIRGDLKAAIKSSGA